MMMLNRVKPWPYIEKPCKNVAKEGWECSIMSILAKFRPFFRPRVSLVEKKRKHGGLFIPFSLHFLKFRTLRRYCLLSSSFFFQLLHQQSK